MARVPDHGARKRSERADRRTCLAQEIGTARAGEGSRSASRRQRSTLPWSPLVSTAGISRPSNSAGRVYCGYSRTPFSKLSSAWLSVRAEHAGDQPHHGFEQHHRGDFAAGQHIVADRDFLEIARLDHALVDPLEPPADDHRARSRRQRARPLPASAACRAGSSAAAAADRSDATPHRSPPPAHPACSTMPAPPPAGVSSTRAVPVGREIAQLRQPAATTVPRAAPRPITEAPSGPGNSSGNSVMMSAEKLNRALPRRARPRSATSITR